MSKYSLLIEKFLKKSIIIYTLLIISLYFIMTYFVTPFSDDFRYFSRGEKIYSVVESIKDSYKYYMTWDGRYTHYFLTSFMPSLYYKLGIINDQVIVKIQAFLMLLLFLISIGLVFRLFIKNWTVTAILIGSTLLTFGGISEYIYWFTGGLAYAMGSICLFFTIFIYETKVKNFKNTSFWFYLLFPLIFIGAGVHQSIALMFLLYFFTVQLFDYIQNRNINKPLLYLFLFSIFTFILVFIAPGNYIRRELWSNTESHATFQPHLLNISYDLLRNMLLHPYGLWVLIISLLTSWIAIHSKSVINKEFVSKMLVFSSLSIIIIQLFFNLALSTHRHFWSPSREAGFFTQLSILFYFSLFVILSDFFLKRYSFLMRILQRLFILVLLGVILLFTIAPNTQKAMYTISDGPKYIERYNRVGQYLDENKDTPFDQIKINCYQDDGILKTNENGLVLIPFSERIIPGYYDYYFHNNKTLTKKICIK